MRSTREFDFFTSASEPEWTKLREGEADLNAQRYEEAFQKFESLANLGSYGSYLYLGEMYEKGQFVQRDVNIASAWYRKAAEAGNSTGQYLLAKLLRNNGHADEAIYWYKKALENGFFLAHYWLAVTYKSIDAQKYKREYDEHLSAAVAAGHVIATKALGWRKIKNGGIISMVSGFVWLIRASYLHFTISRKDPMDWRLY